MREISKTKDDIVQNFKLMGTDNLVVMTKET